MTTYIIAERDGTYTAITATASRNVKSFRSAQRWLKRRGHVISEAIIAR